MEKAIQWWYGQQFKKLEYQATQIRDCLLQDSCVVSRSLELSLLNSNKTNNYSERQWLEHFASFHTALKELSDSLSPPYLEEGLPLAIKYLVTTWQQKLPDCEFRLELPDDWHHQSPAKNRIILTTLEELLKLKLSEVAQEIIIYISLQQTTRENKLEIRTLNLNYSHNFNQYQTQENQYLMKSFEIITSGKCQFMSQDNREDWVFSW